MLSITGNRKKQNWESLRAHCTKPTDKIKNNACLNQKKKKESAHIEILTQKENLTSQFTVA